MDGPGSIRGGAKTSVGDVDGTDGVDADGGVDRDLLVKQVSSPSVRTVGTSSSSSAAALVTVIAVTAHEWSEPSTTPSDPIFE